MGGSIQKVVPSETDNGHQQEHECYWGGFVDTFNGRRVFCRKWTPTQSKPIGIVFISHGVHEHGGRYHITAHALTKARYITVAHDHRGHGYTQGTRSLGDIERFDYLKDDLLGVVMVVSRDYPALPIYLMGHSMGSLVAVSTVMGVLSTRGIRELYRGCIISGFPVQVGPAVNALFGSTRIAKMTNGPGAKEGNARLVRLFPNARSPPLLERYLTHNPEVIAAKRYDTLCIPKGIVFNTGGEITRAIDRFMAVKEFFVTPLLMLHGEDDMVTLLDGARDFYNSLQFTEKQMIVYPKFYHEVLFETDHERVERDVIQFLNDRLDKPLPAQSQVLKSNDSRFTPVVPMDDNK